MAFLNNAGDIIVDAVLTDVGRQRLAAGSAFEVVKFALGDDEIDYALYNTSNASGSAYYDVDVLQTPIFEPSTYSVASMNSKLFSYFDQNLYYLPQMLLNQDVNVQDGPVSRLDTSTNAFDLISSDNFANLISTQVSTSDSLIDARINLPSNVSAQAVGTTSNARLSQLVRRFIRVSQGFNNYQANISLGSLEETSFSIYVNNLFLQVVDKNFFKAVEPAISTNVFNRSQAMDMYKINADLNPTYFGTIATYNQGTQTKLATSLLASNVSQVGKELQFSLQLSNDLASNPSYYFSTYGTSFTSTVAGLSVSAGDSVSVISTTVRVVGNRYGFSVDIPVKLFYK
jgi:hypothetical protein